MTPVLRALAATSAVAALTVAASLSAGASGALSVVPDPTEPAPSESPNVVVVLVDDARVDDMETLPRIRSLIGNKGATFTNSVSPFPLCCPGRATLLTGQYAHNHGVLSNSAPHGGYRVFDDRSTIATWLDDDYATGWVGKYMNQYSARCCASVVPPGWDRWVGALGQSYADYLGTEFNVDGTLVDRSGEYQTDVVTDYAVDFIDASTGVEEPFFLFTSYFAPHAGHPAEPDDPTTPPVLKTPYVSDDHRDDLTGRPMTQGPAFNEADVSDKPAYVSRKKPLSPSIVRGMTEVDQQRKEALLSVQDGVRRIIGSLRAAGELDNTYIVFTSDNGFVLGEHRLQFGKSVPYEPSVRVPLLIRGPGIEPATVVDQPVGAHDVVPSILDMTGQEGAQGDAVLDGLNLLDLIADPAYATDRPIVLERGPPSRTATEYAFHAIRTPQWKYVEYDTGEREMYDLVNDPHELENVADDPAHTATQLHLDRLLDQYAYCAGSECH